MYYYSAFVAVESALCPPGRGKRCDVMKTLSGRLFALGEEFQKLYLSMLRPPARSGQTSNLGVNVPVGAFSVLASGENILIET